MVRLQQMYTNLMWWLIDIVNMNLCLPGHVSKSHDLIFQTAKIFVKSEEEEDFWADMLA